MRLDRVIAVRNTKTVYRDGDKCIKIFNKEYSKAEVLNEALNQARIESTGLNIPRLLEVTMIDGKWAIVFEYIKGRTLAQLMQDGDKRDGYLERFVDLQLDVMSRSCPMLNRLKDKMNVKIRSAELDAVTRYGLVARLEDMPRQNRICHGDFNPSNIVVTENGEMYILDWAHVAQGDSAADAAGTYLYFCMEDGWECAKKYLELFCAKSGIEEKNVRRWLKLVAASQSVKGNKKEREFMLAWVNAEDNE